MLVEQALFFTIMGTLTAIVMGLIVFGIKQQKIIPFLILEGSFFGLVSAVIWIYITGGLEVTLVATVIPVLVSGFFTFLMLLYIPERIWSERLQNVKPATSLISGALLFILCLSFVWSALPVSFASVANVENITLEPVEWNTGRITVGPRDVENFIPNQEMTRTSAKLTMNTTFSTIAGLRMMEEPVEGEYYNFQVTISTEGLWQRPYLKIAVFEDTDGDQGLSEGDVMWSDKSYKLITDASGSWRANCIWENNQPVACGFTTEDYILPIFHANGLTRWKDETDKTFDNTPENYIAPYDMLSWEKDDDIITPKESIVNFAKISDGQETTIKGRIYCHGITEGTHYIIIRAYDATYTDPTLEDVDPIASKIIPFQVISLQSTVGNEWYLIGIIGVVVVVAILFQRKNKWF